MENQKEKEWSNTSYKILKAVKDVETKTEREEMIKTAILVYLWQSLPTEKDFNDNFEIINNKDKVIILR